MREPHQQRRRMATCAQALPPRGVERAVQPRVGSTCGRCSGQATGGRVVGGRVADTRVVGGQAAGVWVVGGRRRREKLVGARLGRR
jgi:hypothetical protein